MKQLPTHIIRFLLTLFVGSLTSCAIDDPLAECSNNVKLYYWYSVESTTPHNKINAYVTGDILQYVFDENDLLVSWSEVGRDLCSDQYVSEFNLPAGRYSVVAWGNVRGQSTVGGFTPGVTTKAQMMLSLNSNPADIQGDSERLYYGYASFRIAEVGMSRVRVDMNHSHCVLHVAVRWDSSPVDYSDGFVLELAGTPYLMDFVPEFVHFDGTIYRYSQPLHDRWLQIKSDERNHIPTVNQYNDLVVHRRVSPPGHPPAASFTTYRIRTKSDPMWLNLYHTGMVQSPGTQAMKSIDLQRFFADPAIDIALDTERKQEYHIELLIDGDRVTVELLMNIADWGDGGIL